MRQEEKDVTELEESGGDENYVCRILSCILANRTTCAEMQDQAIVTN